jgi:antitoxin component of RelBE/YafQ-DinJ toxin-antitoxin module
MSKTRTVRFNEKLDSQVDEYTSKNGLKLNQLINLAVKKYITEPNTINLEPVDAKNNEWLDGLEETFSNHSKAMDELA